ncbi:MAG: phosphotransferase, partial [Elusimicrobia bacterium]|nr:phosphotransferase [Elusimicrobiota bacterium]
DFQSRNVMVRDGEPWFIDYQGGRRGALQYDIASLLYDAKADLPTALRDKLLERYLDAAGERAAIDRARFLELFPGFVYIRIMQALGAYGLRGFYERKAHFLQSIPYAVRNIEHLLRTTELPIKVPALMGVFRSLVGSSTLRQYGQASLPLTVRIQSFSFKQGAPIDEKGHGGGFVFDCRGLPNPGREARFADSFGTDADVVEFLEREPPVRHFLDPVFALVDQSVENYQSRNFTDLLVSFGCTGGRHRSVYCAERLARHLRKRYKLTVSVNHLCGDPRPA